MTMKTPNESEKLNNSATRSSEAVDVPRLVRCKCAMATRMLGDGCRYCNPELGAELQWNSEADDYNQWDALGQDEKDNLIADFIEANNLERFSPTASPLGETRTSAPESTGSPTGRGGAGESISANAGSEAPR